MNRQIAPEIKPVMSIDTRFPKGGNNLFRIDSEEGVSKLEIVFPGAGQAGSKNKFAMGMCINLLMNGHQGKKSADIAGEIDALGGYVFKSSDYYNASITIYGLNENIAELLSIVKKSFDAVDFPEEEIAIYKRNRLSELNINLQKTGFLANRGIHKQLCGVRHPISYQLTEEIIGNTGRDEVKLCRSTGFEHPFFIFTGSASIDVAALLKENGFTIEAFNKSVITDEKPLTGLDKEIIIKKEGSNQNSLRMGALFPGRLHPDYFRLTLLNLVFGGFFGSRLMKNIREDKGLTYGIQSSIIPYNDFSLFKISCEYNSKFTSSLLSEIEHEIQRLKSEPIGDEELITAKNYLCGVLLRSFDGAFQISEKFKSFSSSNLPDTYYTDYFKAIQTIGSQDLMETANNYLKENSLSYCIAGV